MSKRKSDELEEEIDVEESPSKRHKKHKKHKHKKRKEGEGSDEVDVGTPGIKLKIKIGADGSEQATPPKKGKGDGKKKDSDIFKTKKSDEDTSDEEKEWLNALESGTLDDNGLLKKAQDPLLMTARQRARLQGQPEEELMELPSGYKDTKMTEEELQRRQQRAKKRREQAQEKREKDKKLTVERLLKKKETKRGAGNKSGGGSRNKGPKKSRPPGIRYCNNGSGVFISTPGGFPFPMEPRKAPEPPAPKLCGVEGCTNQKKYNCSKTGIPLCSLACYKANIAKSTSETAVKTDTPAAVLAH